MELQQFISDTLFNIKSGLSDGNKRIAEADKRLDGLFVMNQGDLIAFDIAVTVNDESSGNVGAGIRIASIGIGSDLETKTAQGSVSRIKFSLKSNFNQVR